MDETHDNNVEEQGEEQGEDYNDDDFPISPVSDHERQEFMRDFQSRNEVY